MMAWFRRIGWTSWRREAEPSAKSRRAARIRGHDTWQTEARRLERRRDARLRYLFGGGTWSDSDRRVRQRQRHRVARERWHRAGDVAGFLGRRLAIALVLAGAGLVVMPSSWLGAAGLLGAALMVACVSAGQASARQRRKYRWPS